MPITTTICPDTGATIPAWQCPDTGRTFCTGARPSSRQSLLAAPPFVPRAAPPAQVAYVPKYRSNFGNDRYGDCVTAEEGFAKSCTIPGVQPSIEIPEATVIAYARGNGDLNGADLGDVLDKMARKGFQVGAQLYNDGAKAGVDFSNEPILQAAIAQGPVKIAIAAGSLPGGAGSQDGWYSLSARSRNTDHCFTGDTKVSLLDGRELSFRELAAGAAGESFGVYSCDEQGNVVAGHAHSVRKTCENAELVKVTLDNGESIRCTKDHQFLTRDGRYVEAEKLKAGDSLMPLYRDVSKGGYELCYNPCIKGKCGWRATHRIVAFGENGRSGGMAAHHIDFNKRNNDPTNLRVMTPSDHAALHQQFSKKNKTPEHREMASGLMNSLWSNSEWAAKQRAKLAASASARGKRTASLGKNSFQNMDGEKRLEIARRNGRDAAGRVLSAEARQRISEGRRKRIANDPEFHESQKKAAHKASLAAAKKPPTEKQREARRENARKLNARKLECANNHKVVSVELCGREDVYDLTVDVHHNFALSAGVFVHNCTSLCGYGPAEWLYQQLGVPMPSALAGKSGYLQYTWSTIGFVSHEWIMGTVDEAWIRNPTTIGVPPLVPPVPPPPPIPPGPGPSPLAIPITIPQAIPAGEYVLFPKTTI